MAQAQDNLEPFLDNLRALPFVDGAEIEWKALNGAPLRPDAVLRLRTPRNTYELLVDIKRTNLTYGVVDGYVALTQRQPRPPRILFAPHIPRRLGKHLMDHQANFVDEAGNCHILLDENYVAIIEGRKRDKPRGRGRGIRLAGYQVIFALLAEPDLLNEPVREIARRAGTGKTAAADTLERLADEHLITAKKPRRFLETREILDRWLAGYETVVRPQLTVGVYQTQDPDPPTLETRVEALLDRLPLRWAWGGGAAAMRLTQFYRGPETRLHVEKLPQGFLHELRAVPARAGNLTILREPGTVAFDGAQPRTTHPLLVFAELHLTGDERAREAAENIRDEYLQYL